MEQHYDEAHNRWVITIQGDMDIFNAPKVKERIDQCIAQRPCDILLEAQGLTYIDSIGLGTLVSALGRARAYGGAITIRGLKSHVHKLFVITGLDEVFSLED